MPSADQLSTGLAPNATPAYVLRYPDPDFPAVNYDIVALRNGRSIALNITWTRRPCGGTRSC